MSDGINSLSYSKWRCHYHIVFAPKYRRQSIYGKIKVDKCITNCRISQRKKCTYDF